MKKVIILGILTFVLTVQPIFGQGNSFVQNAQDQLNQIEARQATASASISTTTFTFREGVVSSLQGNLFTLQTSSGNVLVYTTDSTKFIQIDTGSKKLIGFSDLKLGDILMVLGLVKNSASGTAKFITRDSTKSVKTFSLFGLVNSVSAKTITINNFNNPNLPVLSLNLDSNLTVTSEKGTPVTNKDLTTKDKIVLTGTIDNQGNQTVNKILQVQSAQAQTTATPSAQ